MRSMPAPRTVWRLLRGTRASVALEFALIGPLLLLFLGGAADLGFAVYCRGKLAAAVSAGAEYAVLFTAANGSLPTASSIAAIVAGAAALGLSSNVPVVSVGTYCIENTPPQLVQNSSSKCPDGSAPKNYATISVSYTPPLFVPVNALGGGVALTESASVALQVPQ